MRKLGCLPKQIGNKPVASGSKAPVCPAFCALKSRRTICNAELELKPKGLLSKKTPLRWR